MGNRITSVRVKRSDGTYSSEIPISPSADKVIWKDNEHNLEEILGNVNTTKPIQNQINQKVSTAQMQEYVDQELANDVSDWLEEHVVIPSGGTVAVDDTLSISDAAADSKTVGDIIDQSIAPKFSSIIDYSKDDCVFYENHLYKFVTDHVAGAWNATHVEVADDLAKQVKQLDYNIIIADDTQPSESVNRLWIDTDSTGEVEVPTMEEFEELEEEVEEIKENLSDTQKYCGIKDTSFESQEGKKFITPSGTISTASGNYHISEPIPVNAGDEVRFTCTVAAGNIVVISLCDENTENIVPVVVGVSGNVQNEYIYRVQEDGYIVLSYRFDLYFKLYILSSLSNIEIKELAENNKIILHEQDGVEKINFVYVNEKKYVTQNGSIDTTSSTFHVTKPIPVVNGDNILFVARAVSSVVMISTCDSNGDNVVPQVVATDNLEHNYVLNVEKDGYIILSYDYTYRADLYIRKNNSNYALKNKLNDLVITSNNLINHRKLINNKSISSQGVISDNVQYAITEKIPVDSNTQYSYRNIERIVYFNSAGSRIGNLTPSANTGTLTTPNNTSYVIILLVKFNSEVQKVYRSTEWQFVKGSTLPDYQQQQVEVNGYRIADSVASFHDNVTAFRRWDKICYDKEPTIFASIESDATTAEDRMTAAIIAKYDALMTDNPLYISKTALGTASDGTSTIYRYDFKTPGAEVASGSIPISANEKTKIILISGVHPEFGGIYGLYNAMREITNNPDLVNIKNGVHFIVIPTVNPYGIDTKDRKNANGVDIARNFEIDYKAGTNPTSPTYAGTTPLSEAESQIVNTILSENRDAIMFASCHSFQLSSDNNVIWGSCASMYTTNVTAKVVEKLSYAWRNKYTSIIPQTIDTILGSAGISTESGSEGKQATKYGIQGLTLESSDYFPYDSQTPHTSFAISRASEVYLNFIATTLGLWESSDPKDLMMIGLH